MARESFLGSESENALASMGPPSAELFPGWLLDVPRGEVAEREGVAMRHDQTPETTLLVLGSPRHLSKAAAKVLWNHDTPGRDSASMRDIAAEARLGDNGGTAPWEAGLGSHNDRSHPLEAVASELCMSRGVASVQGIVGQVTLL